MSNVPRRFRRENGVDRLDGTYLGIVRGAGDPQRNGRLTVWISDLGPDVEDSYITVQYASPFAGLSSKKSSLEAGEVQTDGQTSYGFWATPPDVDNEVLCCFINGDIGRGVWFACMYQQNMNHMVPGIGSTPARADLDSANATADATAAEEPATTTPEAEPQKTVTVGVKLVVDAAVEIKKIYPEAKIVNHEDHSKLFSLHQTKAAVDITPIPNLPFKSFIDKLKKELVVIEAVNSETSDGKLGPHWHVVLGQKGSDQYPGTVNNPEGSPAGTVKLPTDAAGRIVAGSDGVPTEIDNTTPDHTESYGSKFIPSGPPRIEYNKADANLTSPTARAGQADTIPREVFKPLADALVEQGLDGDSERGVSNSSARRDTPSRVFGLLSPRGSTIYIDDGSIEEGKGFIRIRTRHGTQVLVHDQSGYVYMNSKLGKSWVQIGDDGIDMFSEGPISIASGADVNISSGGSTNIQAAGGIRMYTTDLVAHAEGSINWTSEQDILHKAARDTFFIAANNFGAGAGGQIGFDAGGDFRVASCGANIRSAAAILDNAPGAPLPEEAVEPTDTGAVLSRQPTKEPFARGGTDFSHVDGDGNAYNENVSSDGTVSQEPVDIGDVSAADVDWLTVCMIEEARGETSDGLACVAAVIINRVSGFEIRPVKGMEGTIKGVVLANKQFSWLNKGGNDKGRETYGLGRIKYWRGTPTWNRAYSIAKAVIARSYSSGGSGYTKVVTNPKCYWYHTTSVNPSWNRKLRRLAVVGGHIFFWSPTGRSA